MRRDVVRARCAAGEAVRCDEVRLSASIRFVLSRRLKSVVRFFSHPGWGADDGCEDCCEAMLKEQRVSSIIQKLCRLS